MVESDESEDQISRLWIPWQAGGHIVFIKWAAHGDSYLSVGHPFIGLFWFPGAQAGSIICGTKGERILSKQCCFCLHIFLSQKHTYTYKTPVFGKTYVWLWAAVKLQCLYCNQLRLLGLYCSVKHKVKRYSSLHLCSLSWLFLLNVVYFKWK